jgi:hypothetical protein
MQYHECVSIKILMDGWMDPSNNLFASFFKAMDGILLLYLLDGFHEGLKISPQP